MQMGKSIDLLPHVICLRFPAQISNSKLKCSCILVVHNDHMYDLVNMGDLVNMSKCWFGGFGCPSSHFY
jgi:hypothetical protein